MSPSKTDILRQSDDLYTGISEIGGGQFLAATVRTAVIDDIEGKSSRGMLQNAAHSVANFVVVTVGDNAGAERVLLGHKTINFLCGHEWDGLYPCGLIKRSQKVSLSRGGE